MFVTRNTCNMVALLLCSCHSYKLAIQYKRNHHFLLSIPFTTSTVHRSAWLSHITCTSLVKSEIQCFVYVWRKGREILFPELVS